MALPFYLLKGRGKQAETNQPSGAAGRENEMWTANSQKMSVSFVDDIFILLKFMRIIKTSPISIISTCLVFWFVFNLGKCLLACYISIHNRSCTFEKYLKNWKRKAMHIGLHDECIIFSVTCSHLQAHESIISGAIHPVILPAFGTELA